MANEKRKRTFPSAREDALASEDAAPTPQTLSPAYRLAFRDNDFLLRDELRPVRLQLELLKPELLLDAHGVGHTVVIFGGARIRPAAEAEKTALQAEAAAREKPLDIQLARSARAAQRLVASAVYYEEARRLAHLVSRHGGRGSAHNLTVVTGGGPGIMEAGNRGAHEAGAESIGLNIVLPMEQGPNQYITPELCFQFHYFAIRKMHFLMRAKALVAFPGGFGTLDELFETLTLIQTGKIRPLPVLLFGREFWERIVNFEALVEEGTIGPGDLDLFRFVASAEEAWEAIQEGLRESSRTG